MATTPAQPGDALAEAMTANAREIGILLLENMGYPSGQAAQAYDQSPELKGMFVRLAGAQTRRVVTALGKDWDTLARTGANG